MTQQTNGGSGRRNKGPAGGGKGTPAWLGWAIVILAGLIVVAAVVLAIQWMSGEPEPVGAEVQMTPIVGGMAIPAGPAGSTDGEPEVTATTDGSGSADEPAGAEPLINVTDVATLTDSVVVIVPEAVPADSSDPQVAVAPADRFAANQVVTPGEAGVVLHAEPSEDAPIMDRVGTGVEMTVIEPSGDFGGYPVVVDGATWVRVRAADGLVGWALAEDLAIAD